MDFTQMITLLETIATYGDFFKGFGATLSGSADILTGSGNMMDGAANLVDKLGESIVQGLITGSLEGTGSAAGSAGLEGLGSLDLGSASSAGSALLGSTTGS